MKCEHCGGNVVNDKPHYIPLGKDTVLKITDMRCENCNMVYAGGKYQKLEQIENRELCDKLYDYYEQCMHG